MFLVLLRELCRCHAFSIFKWCHFWKSRRRHLGVTEFLFCERRELKVIYVPYSIQRTCQNISIIYHEPSHGVLELPCQFARSNNKTTSNTDHQTSPGCILLYSSKSRSRKHMFDMWEVLLRQDSYWQNPCFQLLPHMKAIKATTNLVIYCCIGDTA